MSSSVVVRAYNEEQHIGRLLTGILRQLSSPKEIIVVDSGSTDATVEIASRFPKVRVVPIAKDEFSFGRSLNRGCAEATGDILVFASAHVYPLFDSWLAELLRPFRDPATALVYGRQVGDETSKYSEQQILAQWFPDRSVDDQDHPFCNNANAAIRRDVWERLPFDEGLTGLEDLDWAQRALRLDLKIAYSSEAVIVHIHQESWRQIADRYRREAIAHKRILQTHRMGMIEALRLTARNITSDWLRAHKERVLRRRFAEIAAFRAAQFWGTYKGFSHKGPIDRSLKERFYYPAIAPGMPETAAPGTPIAYGEDASE